MKRYIIITLLFIPAICFAQKENQLELSFAYGNGYNYGKRLQPVSYYYIQLAGSNQKTYYGIREQVKQSTQIGVLLFPKSFRVGHFTLGFGVQLLKSQSTVSADSLVMKSYLSQPPYTSTYSKTVNLKWELKQSIVQVPVLVRYQYSFNGRNGIYAESGVLFSLYGNGTYPDGVPANAEAEGKWFPAYTAGAGYQHKVIVDKASLYLNAGATYQRTWTASLLGQKYGFLGVRISCALGWALLPE